VGVKTCTQGPAPGWRHSHLILRALIGDAGVGVWRV
jgi:hypothetical protein